MKIEASRPNDGKWEHVSVEVARDTRNPKQPYLWVPEDFDEDRLADTWEGQYPALFSLASDDFAKDVDATPDTPQSNLGDGYKAFEEYRGVRHMGVWQRLDPTKKELFICTTLGTGNIAAASGYQVYEVDNTSEQEVWHNNQMTWNSPQMKNDDYGALWTQKGIRVRDVGEFPLEPDKLGQATQGTPNASNWETCVLIACDTIRERWSSLESEVRRRVIAHEMGHDLTVARTQDYHHPHGYGCLMEYQVTEDNYALAAFCQSCKDALQLH